MSESKMNYQKFYKSKLKLQADIQKQCTEQLKSVMLEIYDTPELSLEQKIDLYGSVVDQLPSNDFESCENNEILEYISEKFSPNRGETISFDSLIDHLMYVESITEGEEKIEAQQHLEKFSKLFIRNFVTGIKFDW
jgi:hypothetical protein